jgi:glycosyltransferase involved in cell wall biosynthesis
LTSITVVIPALNDAPMLRECLALLAASTRKADEIIVVDNASTDETAAVARDAGARVLTQPVRGIWPAASTGYDAARTDVIARLDADSRPPADWLARIDAAFTNSPELDVITGPGDFYDGGPVVTFLGKHLYIAGYFWSMGIWLGNPPIFGSNFAIRRPVWEEVRGLVHRDTREVHDDLDLSLHLSPRFDVRLDKNLRVGISARPFGSWGGLGRRIDWAFRTLGMHFPQATPWRRSAQLRAEAREHSQDSGPGSQFGQSGSDDAPDEDGLRGTAS